MQKSFTLIEVIVAIFLITVGAGGAFSLIQKTISFTATSSSQLTAAYLAQEGIEIVRNIRDSNWLASQSSEDWKLGLDPIINGNNVDYDSTSLENLLDDLVLWSLPPSWPEWRYYHDSGQGCPEDFHYPDGQLCEQGTGNCCLDTHFSRHFEISYIGDAMEVKSIVEWQERGREHEVTVQTKLYNWKYAD